MIEPGNINPTFYQNNQNILEKENKFLTLPGAKKQCLPSLCFPIVYALLNISTQIYVLKMYSFISFCNNSNYLGLNFKKHTLLFILSTCLIFIYARCLNTYRPNSFFIAFEFFHWLCYFFY